MGERVNVAAPVAAVKREISVVVCTRSRAPLLAATLASLGRQTLAADRYEVLVVDNGSSDDTPEVVRRAAGCGANLRGLSEPRTGLSRARNTGVAAAAGAVVAFVDDDALVSEEWLARIAASFAASTTGAVTGRVEPLWEAPRPPWLSDALLPYLSIVDWGAVAGALAPGRWLCGTNMAFRREDLLAVGGFAEDLGRRGEKLLSMEEVDVQSRLSARGVVLRYEPAMVVSHRVGAERLTPPWLERRAFWQGVSNAIFERHAGVLRLRPWLHLAAFGGVLLAAPWRLRGRGGVERVERRCKALLRLGYVLGWARLAR